MLDDDEVHDIVTSHDDAEAIDDEIEVQQHMLDVHEQHIEVDDDDDMCRILHELVERDVNEYLLSVIHRLVDII